MTDLLIEVWQDDDLCQEMAPVIESNDITRRPEAVLLHSFRARSFAEARYLFDIWSGIDAVLADDAFDAVFTPEQRAVQDEYLQRRVTRR